MILYIKNRFFCNKYGEYSGIVDKTLQMSYNAKVVYVRLHRILRAFLSNNISARVDGLPPLRLSCQNNANVCANCATKPRNDRINQFIGRIVHCAFMLNIVQSYMKICEGLSAPVNPSLIQGDDTFEFRGKMMTLSMPQRRRYFFTAKHDLLRTTLLNITL